VPARAAAAGPATPPQAIDARRPEPVTAPEVGALVPAASRVVNPDPQSTPVATGAEPTPTATPPVASASAPAPSAVAPAPKPQARARSSPKSTSGSNSKGRSKYVPKDL
jgi:hypothetical protein